MKTKTKMIIALSLAGVITLGAVIALVVVIASFNATAGSGLSVSYVAKNVEAEVSMGYVVLDSLPIDDDPRHFTYTSIEAGGDEKLTFSSSDTAETVSKSFDEIDEIELTKDGYVYLKYTFKHTGTTENSQNYLNVTLSNTFSELNNVCIEYAIFQSETSWAWMSGLNGLTATRDGNNEISIYVRISVDVKTQNALLDGSFIWSMTTSDTDYHAILYDTGSSTGAQFYMLNATSIVFDYMSDSYAEIIADTTPTSLAAPGSGPINMYQLSDGTVYILSDAEIYVQTCSYMFFDCASLLSITFNNYNTKYVQDASTMFWYCSNLTSVDLSNLDMSNVTNVSYMFQYCSSLTTIYVNDTWTMTNFTDSSNMFHNCSKLVGGNGTVYNSSYIDKTYARIDTAETPGYFTLKTS